MEQDYTRTIPLARVKQRAKLTKPKNHVTPFRKKLVKDYLKAARYRAQGRREVAAASLATGRPITAASPRYGKSTLKQTHRRGKPIPQASP